MCVQEGSVTTPGALIEAGLRDRGFTVDDLASATRLRVGLLSSMLDDDFVDTGGDVYARGHLRTIAGALALDPDELMAAYDAVPRSRRPPTP